jgi:DNA-binding NarL/FixJ family response regulator
MLKQATVSASQGADSDSHRSAHLLPLKRPYSVLVVDDNDQTCQLIQDILQDCSDLQIIGRARDGAEGVALTRLRKPDVVLMDVHLPILDGVEATYVITETYPRVVIIGMSEQFQPSIYNAMRTAGAAAFTCKSEVLGLRKTILYTLRNAFQKDFNKLNLEAS